MEWVTLLISCDKNYFRELMLEVIRTLNDLSNHNAIGKYYFKPNYKNVIHINLISYNTVNTKEIANLIANNIDIYFLSIKDTKVKNAEKQFPNSHIQIVHNSPKILNYGGEAGTEIAEEFFTTLSNIIIKISESGLLQSVENLFEISIKFNVIFLYCIFDGNIKKANKFITFVFYLDIDVPNHPNKIYLNNIYNENMAYYVEYANAIFKQLHSNQEFENDILNIWTQCMIKLKKSLDNKQDNNELLFDLYIKSFGKDNIWSIIYKYMQSTNNLLGVSKYEQIVVNFFLMNITNEMQNVPIVY